MKQEGLNYFGSSVRSIVAPDKNIQVWLLDFPHRASRQCEMGGVELLGGESRPCAPLFMMRHMPCLECQCIQTKLNNTINLSAP